MIDRLLARVAALVIRRPRAVVAGVALVTLGAAGLLPRLAVDPAVTAFLPRDDPDVALLTDGLDGAGTRLLIALAREGAADDVAPLAERLRAVPGVERVLAEREQLFGTDDAGADLARLSPDGLAALRERLEPANRRAAVADLRRILAEDPLGGQQRVLRDPLGLRWILERERSLLPVDLDPASPYVVTADGGTALLALEGAREPFDVGFSTRLVEGVEAALGTKGYRAGVDAHLLGGYAAARGDAARIRHDLQSSLLWSVPLIVLFLTVSARSFVLPHLYLVPVLVAIVWALGFGGALLGPLTPLALSSAAILTGLGVDFAIHLSERWLEERARGGAAAATRISTTTTGRGLVVGMLTSAAAFLSFSTSSIPGLVSFGCLLALGLVAALVATLLLEPLLLARLAPAQRPRAEGAPVVRAALAAARGPAGAPLALGLCALGLAGWVVVGARGLRFDADPAALRPSDASVAVAARAIADRVGFAPIPVRVLVPATPDEPGAALDRIARAAERLTADGDAALVVGPHLVVPTSSARATLDELEERARTLVADVSADLTAEGLRPEPFRPALEELAARLAAEPPVDAPSFRVATGSGAAPTWRADVYATGELDRRARREELRAALLAAFGAGVRIADPHGIGDVVTPVLRRELRTAVLEAAAAVLVCVVLALGGLRRGLTAMVPSVLGFGVTLGALSWWDLALGPGNLMAIPLILGLGVDDGVHLVLRRDGGRAGLRATGNAIWRTSVTTALGFGSLISARTPAIASLGAITVLGVATTLAASLLVLPALWSRRDSRATRRA